MNIHMITPFYRKHLLPTIISYLESENIIWHPVCDEVDIIAFKDNKVEWIEPFLCDPFKPNDMCYRKIDDFIDGSNIIDEDYYCFSGDDDGHEPRFFSVIRQQTAKIIFYSCYRGDSISDEPGSEPHPTYPLIISKLSDVRVCNIGLGQMVIKGSILRQVRFGNSHKWGDGIFAENLKNNFPDDCICLKNLFVFGNFLQPGRFTSEEKFLKKTWGLPKYV